MRATASARNCIWCHRYRVTIKYCDVIIFAHYSSLNELAHEERRHYYVLATRKAPRDRLPRSTSARWSAVLGEASALVFIPQERSFGTHTQVGELARDVRGVRARAVADLYHYDSNILLREPGYESDHPIAGDAAGNGFLPRSLREREDTHLACWIRHDVAFALPFPICAVSSY